MFKNYPNKVLNVRHLVEKYDVPAFACNNFFYQQKRSSNIQQRANETFDTSVDFQESERLENEGLTELIQSAISRLPEIDRIILKEFYIKENSIGDVAEKVGKSRHYVSVRKERALKKIKSEMQKNRQLFNK